MRDRLGHDIPERRAEGPGENESRPEKRRVRDIGPEISDEDQRQRARENERAAFVAERGGIREAITERGAECIGGKNRHPIKDLRLAVRDFVHRDRA